MTKGPLANQLYKRGSIILVPDHKYSNGLSRPKYFLLLENFNNNHESIVIITSTTKGLDKYKNKPWTVFLEIGTIEGMPKEDHMLDCNNYLELSKETLMKNKCKYINSLNAEIMLEVEKALLSAYRIPPELMLRIRPQSS